MGLWGAIISKKALCWNTGLNLCSSWGQDVSSLLRKLCDEFNSQGLKRWHSWAHVVSSFQRTLCVEFRHKGLKLCPWCIIISKKAVCWIPLNRVKKMSLMGPWWIFISEKALCWIPAHRVKKMSLMSPWRIIISKNALCWNSVLQKRCPSWAHDLPSFPRMLCVEIPSYRKDSPHGPMTYHHSKNLCWIPLHRVKKCLPWAHDVSSFPRMLCVEFCRGLNAQSHTEMCNLWTLLPYLYW